jgi:predicted amidohydrolase
MDLVWENRDANHKRALSLLERSGTEPGSLVALPEMFATGFSMNVSSVAEPYGGSTEQFLAQMARRFSVFLVAGVAALGKSGRPRNKALIFSPNGELMAYYSKCHLFTVGGETTHYQPGTKQTAFQWGEIRVSPFICYDLRFPELFRIVAAQHRPELFIVIANFPAKRILHWVTLLQARAIENQAYVLGVNRVGTDPFYTYNGRSMLVSPLGEILADAGETEGVASGVLDLGMLREYRRGLPFLNDLRAQELR